MQIGFIGLGRMGLNMVTRLLQGGHTVVAYDRSADAVARAEAAGAKGVTTLETLIEGLAPPRAVWVMVPSGDPTESTVPALGRLLSAGDTIVDGGNTNFHDDVRRAQVLATRQVEYVDAGTSGGIWGLQEGYCLMVGGKAEVCARLEPIFKTLAPTDGYLHVGGPGAGHYVKMIHNGIEYGLLQAYARARAMPKATTGSTSGRSPRSGIHSSVDAILAAGAGCARSRGRGSVGAEGLCRGLRRGRWTLPGDRPRRAAAGHDGGAVHPFRSRDDNPFAERMLAALRNQFGGHAVKKSS
jgi:6-phosphogluconate dehydrogenase